MIINYHTPKYKKINLNQGENYTTLSLLNPPNFKKETIRTDISTACFWDPYTLFRQKQEKEVKKQFYSGGIFLQKVWRNHKNYSLI